MSSADVGLATPVATSRDDLPGRGLMAALVRIDRQLFAIVRHPHQQWPHPLPPKAHRPEGTLRDDRDGVAFGYTSQDRRAIAGHNPSSTKLAAPTTRQ